MASVLPQGISQGHVTSEPRETQQLHPASSLSQAATSITLKRQKRYPPKKITDLARNLLLIVCESLNFKDIVMLALSNRRLHLKLDDTFDREAASSIEGVSYLKRRGTLHF
jgi:hypothetical protein